MVSANIFSYCREPFDGFSTSSKCIHRKCYPYVIKVKSSNRIPSRNSSARGLRIWILILCELPPCTSFLILRVGIVTEPILRDVSRMKVTKIIVMEHLIQCLTHIKWKSATINCKLINKLSEVMKRKEVLLFLKHSMFQAFFPPPWNTCMAPFCYS